MMSVSLPPKSYVITTLLLLVVVVTVALVTYFVHTRALQNEKNEANATLFNPGEAAAYVDMQGNTTNLDDYRGYVVIVNSWASWSPYAVTELPLLDAIAEKYKDKKVVVLAFNRKENRDQADRFLNSIPPLTALKIIVDTTDFFYGATGGYAMPETLIYNREGTVVEHIRGTLTTDMVTALLDPLLPV